MGSQQEGAHALAFGYNLAPPMAKAQAELFTPDQTQRFFDFIDFAAGSGTSESKGQAFNPPDMKYTEAWMMTPVQTELVGHATYLVDDADAGHFSELLPDYHIPQWPPMGISPTSISDARLPAGADANAGTFGAHSASQPYGLSAMVPAPSTTFPPSFTYVGNGYGTTEAHSAPQQPGPVYNFYPTPSIRMRQSRPSAEVPQFGSDTNFNTSSYQPPANGRQELFRKQQEQVGLVSCLKRTESAAPTRASSPVLVGPPFLDQPSGFLPAAQTNNTVAPQTHRSPSGPPPGQIKEEEDPPRKRKKSGPSSDQDQVVPHVDSKIRGRRPARAPSPLAESEASAPKRRKRQAPSGSTPPKSRQNLTENQKKQNHIQSEKKRRDHISAGFQALPDVVPGINGKGLSKALQLQEAAKFIKDLADGNERLRKQLEELEAHDPDS